MGNIFCQDEVTLKQPSEERYIPRHSLRIEGRTGNSVFTISAWTIDPFHVRRNVSKLEDKRKETYTFGS